MKRARPKNKKAAQKLMRQRELEYLRRQREERDKEIEEETGSSSNEEHTNDSGKNTIPFESFAIPEINDYIKPLEDNESADEAEGNIAHADIEDVVEGQNEGSENVLEDKIESSEMQDKEEFDEENTPGEVKDNTVYEEPEKVRTRTDIDLDLPRKTKKKKKSIGKRIFKVLVSIMVILIVMIFVTLGFGLFDDSQILAPLENGKINVLMLGVDESGLRTDAVMVASYDVNAGKINMLSIPRDTKIYVQNRKMTRKINEIHAISSNKNAGFILGTQAMAETVQTLTGIPINYYVEFSFASIDHLFDILGPVEFDVPDVEGNGQGMNYDDPYQNLHIHLKPGLQKLSGNQVQQFLRYRKSNSGKGTGSDTDRVARQQEFVKAVIDQKVNLSTLLKLPNIFSQLSREIKTNISLNDITKYVRYFNKLSGEGITTYSLPGEAKTVGGGSYFVANLEETKALMRDTFGYDSEVSDSVTLSETNPQKPLRVTNVAVTPKPTQAPTVEPTKAPTKEPTKEPTDEPTKAPTKAPTKEPTKAPVVTKEPTKAPAVTKEPEDEIIILE